MSFLELSLRMAAWVAATLFVAAVALLGARHLRDARPSIHALSFLFLMIFLPTLLLALLGLSGMLRPLPISLVSLGGLGGIALAPSTRRELFQAASEARDFGGMLATWWASLPTWLRRLTVLAIAASGLRFGFLIWALPPFVWDSLSYHLTNVAHWTQAGRIELFETAVPRIYNPANYEVFATWFTVFLHHDVVVEAAGIPAYFLAILATYSIARSLGLSRQASWMGALAYGSTPALIIAATGTKNDPHIAAYFLSMLAIVSGLSMQQDKAKPRDCLGQLSLLALLTFLALGTKIYVLYLLPGLLPIAIQGKRFSPAIGFWWDHLRASASQFVRLSIGLRLFTIGLLTGGIFLGIFWNLRNWIVTGNPFYPYDVVLAGRTILEGPEAEFRFELGELLANLHSIAAKFGDHRDPIRPDLPNTTGWGWFAYGLGIPSLAWALIRWRGIRAIALGFAISFLLLLMSTGPSPWNMRFMIWIPALFSISYGKLVDRMAAGKHRAYRSAMFLLAVICLGLNFTTTLNYNRVSAEEFRSMLQLPVLERHSALFRDNMPEPFARAVEVVPNDAVLGYNVHVNGFVYPLYRADFSQAIVFIPLAPELSCEAIAARIEAEGTRYLLVAPEHTDDTIIARLRECAGQESPVRERARGIYVVKR